MPQQLRHAWRSKRRGIRRRATSRCPAAGYERIPHPGGACEVGSIACDLSRQAYRGRARFSGGGRVEGGERRCRDAHCNQINLIKASINDQYNAAVVNEKALGDQLVRLKAAALDLRGRSYIT